MCNSVVALNISVPVPLVLIPIWTSALKELVPRRQANQLHNWEGSRTLQSPPERHLSWLNQGAYIAVAKSVKKRIPFPPVKVVLVNDPF